MTSILEKMSSYLNGTQRRVLRLTSVAISAWVFIMALLRNAHDIDLEEAVK